MNAVEVATVFARALDAEDFDTAAALLTPECEYVSPEGLQRGPAAIMASYRSHAEWARANLDEVGYECAVEPGADGSARILYIDRVRKGDRRHEYRCAQAVTVIPGGGIVRITHEEIDGERESLRDFFARCGLK